MNQVLSNPEFYSGQWKKESEHLESNGIYKLLSEITPKGNILEFGCGIGKGTCYLSNSNKVLSLDNNQHLINIAQGHLNDNKSAAVLHHCDFFKLTDADKRLISDFKPEVIVGWFIGSHGEDIFEHTPEEPDGIAKSKLYREKIEDIIISPDVCIDSVKYIHLVSRGGRVAGFSDEVCFKETKRDYDTHVFSNVGFEVYDVKNFPWPREGSEFQYGQAHNPILAEGDIIPTITSLIARRV